MTIATAAESLAHWRTWVGNVERQDDQITAAPLAALAATLDRDEPDPVTGSDVPPLAHWLFCRPLARHSELGADGHPARGSFLPPVSLPRRMWAGSRIAFHHPLQVGDSITRTSRILDVKLKSGRCGDLVLVTVHHEVANARGVALTEEHDILYRDAARPGAAGPAATPAPSDAQYSRQVDPDAVLLFRYSALTFNGHRIHYDRDHATRVEGYPGLVVHGPLVATLLVDLLRRQHPAATLRRFEFRALRPLFDIHPFRICGRDDAAGRVALWACDRDGGLAMQASAALDRDHHR